MKLSKTGIALLILVVLAATPGCGLINRVRAKNELNEAARAYKEGHFSDAEAHSKRAEELDPNNKVAEAFLARTIHAQYKPGVDTPANKSKAREAVDAYKKLLLDNPKSEEAYKAIAALLGPLKEDIDHNPDPPEDPGRGQRSWVQARANDSTAPASQRAEAYTVLASKDWDCSYKITELNKQTQQNANRAVVVYKKPANQKDYDDAKMCVARGLEEANRAIQLDPNSESAWSYKTNLLLEQVKLAEMDGKTDEKAAFQKQADEAQKQTIKLNEENQKKKKEEEAKKAPSPPTT
jgi:hypothetical protein